MNIILLEKIAKLGDIGEAVKVKSGYARNFLFPQGKAVPATRANLEEFEERRAELLAAHNEKIAHAQSRAGKLADLSIEIEVNASDEGRLFGSVAARDVAEAVNEKAGSDLARSEVILPGGSIRQCGEYEVIADLGFEVTATFALKVFSPNAPEPAPDEADKAESGKAEAESGGAESEAAAEASGVESEAAPAEPAAEAAEAETGKVEAGAAEAESGEAETAAGNADEAAGNEEA